jgi:hypothetical protein
MRRRWEIYFLILGAGTEMRTSVRRRRSVQRSMSGFGGKADIQAGTSEGLLLAKKRHGYEDGLRKPTHATVRNLKYAYRGVFV